MLHSQRDGDEIQKGLFDVIKSLIQLQADATTRVRMANEVVVDAMQRAETAERRADAAEAREKREKERAEKRIKALERERDEALERADVNRQENAITERALRKELNRAYDYATKMCADAAWIDWSRGQLKEATLRVNRYKREAMRAKDQAIIVRGHSRYLAKLLICGGWSPKVEWSRISNVQSTRKRVFEEIS